MQEGQTEEEGAASQMCFSLYASCQHGRGLIKSDLPKCLATKETKVFFGQVVGQDILVRQDKKR